MSWTNLLDVSKVTEKNIHTTASIKHLFGAINHMIVISQWSYQNLRRLFNSFKKRDILDF